MVLLSTYKTFFPSDIVSVTIASASALGARIGKWIVLNDLLIFEPLLDFHGMPDGALRCLEYYFFMHKLSFSLLCYHN